VVAAFGNRGGLAGPVLLDFGRTAQSHDNGPGDDWALISVFPQFQDLVSPTMCVWAGPRGIFEPQGEMVDVSVKLGGQPGVTVTPNPDPQLAQDVVWYGHGVGFGGPGVGTARTAGSIVWTPRYLGFVGPFSPGDSGSGMNIATGQAAGILTHLVLDPMLRYGVSLGVGTRATEVPATLADGQLLAYPAPAPGLP
jgi:hypothetical protein